jgi:hypothetical protein
MEAHLGGRGCPDVCAEERALRDLVKRIRKLRWIGKEEEAARIQIQLSCVKSQLTCDELVDSRGVTNLKDPRNR